MTIIASSEMQDRSSQPTQDDMMNILRPPVLQPSTVVNKAAFNMTLNLAAASVRDNRNLTRIRQALSKSADIITYERLSPIVPDPDASLAAIGRKALVLQPAIAAAQPETWGPVLSELVSRDEVGVVPYELRLDYNYWTQRDVLTTLLPPELHDDIPAGFNTAGHVAHLNLRDHHLPYKTLIAQVLVDKNQHIRTVINKTDNVGTESEFRTFGYEVLAGPDDLNVEVCENGCVFRFDYSRVYWNSKLESEHTRLVRLFKPGEVVCDVMAGVGPFAVPAGKRGVFVWANDYNPDSYKYLKEAVTRNKVHKFVRPFNADGRDFIRQAADSVLAAHQAGEAAVVAPKQKPSRTDPTAKRPGPTITPIPPTISHFVMNLPASAIDFLPSFRGLYATHEALFSDSATATPLPTVHVHCFAGKSEDAAPRLDVVARIAQALQVAPSLLQWDGVIDMPGDAISQESIAQGKVAVHLVRDVAPAKSMYCASFRLPAEVAFAPRERTTVS